MKILPLAKSFLFCLLSAVLLALLSSAIKPQNSHFLQLIVVAGCVAGTWFLNFIFARWGKLTMSQIGLSPNRSSISRAGAAFALGLLLPCIQLLVVYIAGGYNVSLNSQLSLNDASYFLVLYVLLASREELTFRAFPLFNLASEYSAAIAVGFTSLLFIAEHIISGMPLWSAVIGPGLGGILYGILAIRTRGLAVPIGVHAAWNLGQWILGAKTDAGLLLGSITPGKEEWVNVAGWIGYVLAMILGIFVASRLNRSTPDNGRERT